MNYLLMGFGLSIGWGLGKIVIEICCYPLLKLIRKWAKEVRQLNHCAQCNFKRVVLNWRDA